MSPDDSPNSPSCLKMFNMTGSHLEGYPNWLNPGNSRTMLVHSRAGPKLNPVSTVINTSNPGFLRSIITFHDTPAYLWRKMA